jgi:chromosome partitioning protein
MHRILAITNQKGGVGKTTTTVNLAASLAATKRRVLLIDIDPQGNATMGCGVDKRTVARSTTDVLLGDCEAAAALLDLDYAPFKLMPSNQDLVAAEVQLMGKPGCESRLRDALQPVREQFDIVLIDCPPALNMLTVNALVAADGVLIPMQCEYYALEGLTALVDTIEQIKAGPNPGLEIDSISATRCSARSFRATCGSRKRRATANRRCTTTANRAARSPTWRSRAR